MMQAIHFVFVGSSMVCEGLNNLKFLYVLQMICNFPYFVDCGFECTLAFPFNFIHPVVHLRRENSLALRQGTLAHTRSENFFDMERATIINRLKDACWLQNTRQDPVPAQQPDSVLPLKKPC